MPNTRTRITAQVLGRLACLFCFAGSVQAGGGFSPDWRFYRPTNTGILGDFVQTIFVDEQDQPWVAAYTPFWEEGGMSLFSGGLCASCSADANHDAVVNVNDLLTDKRQH